ncbi:MAG TPA: hypothetical protein VD813_03575, partial [Pseudonocardia sp.]|nr:hypothetical protein [Pseudonocardia sp.]
MAPADGPRHLINPYAGHDPDSLPSRTVLTAGRAFAAGAIGLGAVALFTGTAAADDHTSSDAETSELVPVEEATPDVAQDDAGPGDGGSPEVETGEGAEVDEDGNVPAEVSPGEPSDDANVETTGGETADDELVTDLAEVDLEAPEDGFDPNAENDSDAPSSDEVPAETGDLVPDGSVQPDTGDADGGSSESAFEVVTLPEEGSLEIDENTTFETFEFAPPVEEFDFGSNGEVPTEEPGADDTGNPSPDLPADETGTPDSPTDETGDGGEPIPFGPNGAPFETGMVEEPAGDGTPTDTEDGGTPGVTVEEFTLPESGGEPLEIDENTEFGSPVDELDLGSDGGVTPPQPGDDAGTPDEVGVEQVDLPSFDEAAADDAPVFDTDAESFEFGNLAGTINGWLDQYRVDGDEEGSSQFRFELPGIGSYDLGPALSDLSNVEIAEGQTLGDLDLGDGQTFGSL